MKHIFLIILSFCFTDAFSQASITELKFPYHKGYELRYSGPMITLNHGDYDTTSQGFVYKIPNEKTVKKENWVVFSYGYAGSDTTLIVANTYLTQDKRGMSWWAADSATKTFDKQRTWALKLPLKVGKKWKTYFNNLKATITCTTTDTTIETEVGSLKAFGTCTQFIAHKTSEYQVISYVYEYYNQEIGKIMSRDEAVFEFFKTGRKILISDGYLKVYYYTGYIKK